MVEAEIEMGHKKVLIRILLRVEILRCGNFSLRSTCSKRTMQAWRSIPKSTKVQLIPSFLYSSCSSTNMWWLKNCCNFSLQKLIQICSKPLYCFVLGEPDGEEISKIVRSNIIKGPGIFDKF